MTISRRIRLQAAILFVTSMLGCGLVPKPSGHVSSVQVAEQPELVNGQLDWGGLVTFTVTNSGVEGMIHVVVTLSCSEGQWSRTQDLDFSQNQSMPLTYFFPEPTVNATNYQAQVTVTP